MCIRDRHKGYEVHYASNYNMPFYGEDNKRLDGTGIIRHQIDFARSPYSKQTMIAYRQLKKLMKENSFNLVHCHTPMGGVIGRLAAKTTHTKPLIYSCLLYTSKSYEPTDTGESPLAGIPEWVNTTCPYCGGPAKRETDTMPQWAGSSWYFLRYFDNKNDQALADYDKMKYWMPVDWYNGGMEHVTRHLLYSRFWHKFLYDIGVVPTAEPYKKRTMQGLILGSDGEKMSKSKGNVVNPCLLYTSAARPLRDVRPLMKPSKITMPRDTVFFSPPCSMIMTAMKPKQKRK